MRLYLFSVNIIYVLCFKQKTAYEFRISDWSSDVCSSDLSQLTFLAVPAIADKSRIYGTELSARWNVADETKLDVSLVAQNARYTDFSGPGYDYSGFRMASAPVLTVVAGLQQGFDLGSSGHLVGRVSAQYNSGF